MEELHLYNITIDYRNVISKQKFGDNLKIFKIINKKQTNYLFDIKDIESISTAFKNLEVIEFHNCKLDDKIAFILISSLPKLSKNFLNNREDQLR